MVENIPMDDYATPYNYDIRDIDPVLVKDTYDFESSESDAAVFAREVQRLHNSPPDDQEPYITLYPIEQADPTDPANLLSCLPPNKEPDFGLDAWSGEGLSGCLIIHTALRIVNGSHCIRVISDRVDFNIDDLRFPVNNSNAVALEQLPCIPGESEGIYLPHLCIDAHGERSLNDRPENGIIYDQGFMCLPNGEEDRKIVFYHLTYDGIHMRCYRDGFGFVIPIDRIMLACFDFRVDSVDSAKTSSSITPLSELMKERRTPSPLRHHLLQACLNSNHDAKISEAAEARWEKETAGLEDLPVPLGKIALLVEGQKRYLYPPFFAHALHPEGFLFEESFSLPSLEGVPLTLPEDCHLSLACVDFVTPLLRCAGIPDYHDLVKFLARDDEEAVKQLQSVVYFCGYLGLNFYDDFFVSMLPKAYRKGY